MPLPPRNRTTGGWIYTSIHDFTGGTDGGWPAGGAAVDNNDNIFGTTYQGGAMNCDGGDVCEMRP